MEEFIRRLPEIYNAEGTSLQNSKEGRDELLVITREKLADFVAAGILPTGFVDEILPYLAQESVNFTRNTDGENYDVLGCNFGMGVNPPFYVTHYYAVETGQAYLVDMSLPFIYELYNADFEAAAENLVAYLGLDVYDDWQLVPEKYLYQNEIREGFLNGSRRFESQSAGLYTHAQWHPDRERQNMVFTMGLGILQPDEP